MSMMLLHWNVDTDFASRTCFPRRNNVTVKNSEQLSLPMRLINNVPIRKLHFDKTHKLWKNWILKWCQGGKGEKASILTWIAWVVRLKMGCNVKLRYCILCRIFTEFFTEFNSPKIKNFKFWITELFAHFLKTLNSPYFFTRIYRL